MAANAYIVCGRCGAAGHHFTLCRVVVRPDLTLSQVVVECPAQPIIPVETRWPDLDSLKRGLGAWNNNMGSWAKSFSDFLEQVEEMSTYFDASICSVKPYSEGINVTFDVPNTRVALAVAERITSSPMNEPILTNSTRPTHRRRPAQGSSVTTGNARIHGTRPRSGLNSSQPRVSNNPTSGRGHGNNSMGSKHPVTAPKLVNHPTLSEQPNATKSSSLGDSDNNISDTVDLGRNSLLNSSFERRGISHAPRYQPQIGYSTPKTTSAAPFSFDTISMAHIPRSSLPQNTTGVTATNRKIIPPRRRRPGMPGAGSSLRQPSSSPAVPDQHNPSPSTHKTVRFVELEPDFSAARHSLRTGEPQGISAERHRGETPRIYDNETSEGSTRGTIQLPGKKRIFADIEFNTDVEFEVEQGDGDTGE